MVNPYAPPKAPVDTGGLPGPTLAPGAGGQELVATRVLPRWLSRLLLLITLGGGVTGLAFTAQLAPRATDAMTGLLLLLFLLVFVMGIYAGWRLSEAEPAGIRWVRWYLALQVPFISSPFFGVGFISAVGVRLGISDGKLMMTSRLGSEAWLSVNQGAPWSLGVNVVALVLLVLCSKARLKR